jgi:Dolichyl-phosphate-mannose-protein mannosyltransferase
VIAQEISKQNTSQQQMKNYRWLLLSSCLAMISAFVLFSALLPINGLGFSNALLAQWGKWTYALTSFLFPGWELQPGFIGPRVGAGALAKQGGQALLLFVGVCSLLLLLYMLAVHRLPAIVSRRYIIYAALLIGLTGILTPMLTSQDLLSYIMYARMEAIYHVNPLTTIPIALRHDVLYRYLYWKNQPSIYGPTWIILTGGLQWIFSRIGLGSPVVMVVVLRIIALGAHIGSSLLIWSISGHLQPNPSDKQLQTRKRTLLAFAWNPLLLMEASINAHNDTFVLLFILLACWFLVRPSPSTIRTQIYAMIMLALATAIKINILVLIPGLVLYLWTQRQWLRTIVITLTVYVGLVVALYAPFWQNGAALAVLSINPGTNLNINTLAEFLADFFNAIAHLLTGYTVPAQTPFPAERFTHTTSTIIFLLIYGMLCLRAIYKQHRLYTPLQLFHFLTLIWFLYCMLGAPWFWPWYTITFFGLFALLEATEALPWQADTFWGTLTIPRAVRLFTIGVFGLYLFSGQFLNIGIPGFSPMRWNYLRGLWAWLIPVYVFSLYARSKRHQWMRFLAYQRLKVLVFLRRRQVISD